MIFRCSIIAICMFVFTCQAQIGNVIGATSKSHTISQNALDTNLKQVIASITANADSDSDKAYAIYKWIATTITYDNQLRHDRSLQGSIYTTQENVLRNVLERRKALCGGYAILYVALCKQVGIESKIIHGYTKMPAEFTRKNDKVHHSWNAVKINGSWKLLDITYANSNKLNGATNDFWYDTHPDTFLLTHLPENNNWTLSNRSISLREFDAR